MLSSKGLKKLPNSPVFRLVCTPKAAKVAFASGLSGLLCENRIVLLHGRHDRCHVVARLVFGGLAEGCGNGVGAGGVNVCHSEHAYGGKVSMPLGVWLSIIIISPGLDSRPGPPLSTCWRAWSAGEGRC